ncbi:MAG: TonB-dependent receptor [Bryobacteraceae bacterium]
MSSGFAQTSAPDSPPAIPPQKEVVVVTGTFEPIPLEEADRSVDVLTVRGERLLFDSFADYLKLDSSVNMQERAPNTIQSDISIRGGTFGQTLVLLNGMSINDAQSGHHNMDLPLPLDAVSELQILNGSGSAEYGSDAVGGVVNILTRQPSDEPELRLRGGLGNFGVNEESGSVSLGGDRLSEQLFAARDFSTGFMPDRDYRDLELTSISHAKTRLGFTDLLLTLSDRPFGADQFYGDYPSWERTKGWFASIRQELGPNTEADFAYRRHTDLYVLFRDDPQIYTNRHLLDSYEGALRRKDKLPIGGQLHYGAEYYDESIDSNNLGIHARNHEAVYASWDTRALRRFSFNLGVRDDIYDGLSNQVSPTASAGYWISGKLKARASASRAFRLPSYTDLYYSDPSTLGNPNLRPEKSWNYEGGLDYFAGRRFKASATVFQRRDTDLIDYVLDPQTNVYQATNFQHLVFSGFEGSLQAKLWENQEISVSYTGLVGGRSAIGGVISKYVFNYPINNAVLGWQGSIRSWLVGRTRIGVLDRYGRNPYAIWDASLARPSGRVRPFLQFTNLTDTVYQEVLGVAMPRRGVVGGVEIVAPLAR